MTLEVRIAISPRPAWLNRTRLIAASVRQFYPDAIIRAYIGDPAGRSPLNESMVAKALCDTDIDVEWIPRGDFLSWQGTRSEYIATMNARWKPDVQGTHVLILDADVLMVRPIPELFEHDAVQGVQAHVAPISDQDWRALFRLFCGDPQPKFDHLYSGTGIMCPIGLTGPFYPNSGVIFAPRHLFEKMCGSYHRAITFMRGAIADTYWFDQLAVALAVHAADVPHHTMPLRFNFPNQAAFDEAHPGEVADIRFIHYLRTDIVHRDRDFEDVAAMRNLIARYDLTGSNEALRSRVAGLIRQTFEPAPLACVEDAPWA
jgi:hypothetical protein